MSALLRDCGPLGWMLLAGIPIVLFGLRTRLAWLTVVLGFILLGLGLEGACFDGQPHIGQKFDVTFFVWAKSVELRILAGATVLVLSIPIGRAVGRITQTPYAGLGGLLMLGIVGIGVLASGIYLRKVAIASLQPDVVPEAKLQLLHHAVDLSSRLLLGSAVLAAVSALFIVVKLLRWQRIQT